MPHWQTCMNRMEKLWVFSFQSSQTTSLVGSNEHFMHSSHHHIFHSCAGEINNMNQKNRDPVICTESTKDDHHSEFIIIWQVPQTLATYHTHFQVSIRISTSAPMRLTTRRNTPKQQVCLRRTDRCNRIELHCNQTFLAVVSFPLHLVVSIYF